MMPHGAHSAGGDESRSIQSPALTLQQRPKTAAPCLKPCRMAFLLEALGAPPADLIIPGGGRRAWAGVRERLEAALRSSGCFQQFRSWQALWVCSRGLAAPSWCTWGALCNGLTIQHFVQRAVSSEGGASMKFALWNVRWLVSPHTQKAAAKKAVTLAALNAGRIITLVETHWSDADAACWGGCFANATVIQSLAQGGPHGGRQGGVAVILPARFSTVGHTEI